jgi:hypothetical protein
VTDNVKIDILLITEGVYLFTQTMDFAESDEGEIV